MWIFYRDQVNDTVNKKNTDKHRSLDVLFIICETELDLPWRKKIKISEIFNNTEVYANPPIVHASATSATNASFRTNGTKRYVPGIQTVMSILSINDLY